MLPRAEVRLSIIELSTIRTLYSRPHRYVQDYLNNVHIQSLLGVDPAAVNYTWANMELNIRFDGHSDYWSFQAEHHVAALLERGVRALIYVGATDWICNWVRAQGTYGQRS